MRSMADRSCDLFWLEWTFRIYFLCGKSRGTQIGTIFYRTRSEQFRLCPFMDIVVFHFINHWLLFVLWCTKISINFEFESHSTAYISVIIAILW
jgi:hypothetical protein